MAERSDDDDTLAVFFDAARDRPGDLPDDLSARILADATAVLSARTGRAPAPPRGWLAALGAALGGWPSLAGLATAAVAGVWIGAAQPVALEAFGLTAGPAAYELEDLMPAFDDLASEG